MGGGNVPKAPAFQGSQYQFGNDIKSKTYKEKNNVITQFNPTTQEKQAYDYIQSTLKPLYANAITGQNFDKYTNEYVQNQKNLANKDFENSIRLYKAGLVSSGQNGSSEGLSRLRPLQDSYMQTMADINANAPTYANQLRNNELAYNSNLLANAVNGLNQFYNTGNTFNSNATQLSQFGNDWANKNFQNQIEAYKLKQASGGAGNLGALIGGGAALALAPFTGGASLAYLPAAMGAGKTVGGMIK